MKTLKTLFLLIIVTIIFTSCNNETSSLYSETFTIQKNVLADKIKGGWAGQVIGCTYGGPTEFQYCGTMIQDYVPILWDESRMLWYFENLPGLYDDIYMDLTFVEVFEKEGLDAPVMSHAKAFANAEYKLWHANQAARYNILNGMKPPATGFWENNPHSDDIDFQIEADFAGLMSPGMVNTASAICDKIGHIMNYGDGWYGGVYVAAMYSLAFISDDVEFIVNEGLKSIPTESDFYQCIADVISWHRKYPNDWKRTWFECEKKWSSDIGCPSGVFTSFNIDAKLNAAYIIIGLLYGEGDYGKTIDISTRCGQDSDCNPASAAGILGVKMGYSNIPDYWKQGIDKVEDINFKYTDISLNDVYKMGFDHALQNILINDGLIRDTEISIKPQKPETVKFEKGFEDHYPLKIQSIDEEHKLLNKDNTRFSFEFEGNAFVLRGKSISLNEKDQDYPIIEVYIDNVLYETVNLPTDFTTRRPEICWKYNLIPGKHTVKIELLNPGKDFHVRLYNILIYNDKP
ncbi:MAG: ADP-ribosylglycohydrolase family protein, partial [Candidatus Marinimicrobia bacterium]|nr:ADP-ribosylglycohydrolase family protein [Candidatus Neomarinimicrobiota bacterium]